MADERWAVTDDMGAIEALRRALQRYVGRGDGWQEALSCLETVARRQGCSPTAILTGWDGPPRLDEEQRRWLLEALSRYAADATLVEATAAPPVSDTSVTRIASKSAAHAAADPDRTRPSSSEITSRSLPVGSTPSPAPTMGAETGGGERTWPYPADWRDTRSGELGPGSMLKQRFVLEELIGHGGMGAVYRARDLRKQEAQDRNPFVALKLLNDEFRGHPEALVALQREARKAQRLAHPNIGTVYDFDRDGRTVFLSMEFLQGAALDSVIRERAAFGLPQKEALRLTDRMARGLAYAHQEGFVHSDFKPGNVFLTKEGNIKILDFGIARAAKVSSGGGDQTRFDPATIGAITPAYASPQMHAGEPPEPADDVYALACVAYELLTGQHPFLDSSGRKISADEAMHQGLQPAPIRGVSKRVNRVIARGLAFERAARFVNAGAFLDAIKEPRRLRRFIVPVIGLLVLLAAASWWITIRESGVFVSLNDLPPALGESRELILQGNEYMKLGEVAQAHKAYAQAWDSADVRDDVSARARSRLKVIVDRRVDEVIGYYLQQAQREDTDKFTLEVLRLTLESLRRGELGTRKQDLERALQQINVRLE
ncbi:MAG: serine/threonine protein kinase [Nitrococcus mobilis]|nr:serine/threonine protein kinase [Nitrococcus mobilis]